MTPEALRDALAALPVTIATSVVACRALPIADYPGGARPSAVVTLSGAGCTGDGEHVEWTDAAHAAFAVVAREVPLGRRTVGDWCESMRNMVVDPYDRAALESAAIALALRQHGRTLIDFAERPTSRLRVVRSLAPGPDPSAALAGNPDAELKLDVDPAWTSATWAALGASGRVAVVDFKGRGTQAQVRDAHRALPDAWLEDPPPGAPAETTTRTSLDASITSVAVLDALPAPPAAVNVKVPRMGGVFAALDALAWCGRRGIPTYMGGMWEVGPGRRLSRDLARLFSPDGPNDVALLE